MSAAPLRWTAGGRTEAPRWTVDHLLIDSDLGLFAVLDAGGSWAENRHEANLIGAEVIQQVIREGIRSAAPDPRLLIEQAFRTAADAIRAEVDENGWHSAASVALALIRGGQVHISWLGDCLAHRISGDDVEPLTWPHTIREVMLRMGTLTAEVEQKQNPGFARILMHCLGGDIPAPLEVISFTPQRGERVVLTTDGVHDVLPPSALLAICHLYPEPQLCANHLVALARERGSRDNCTCAVIAFA